MELRYVVSYYIELRTLKRVIPQDTLVTTADLVPCLYNQELPNSPERIDIKLSRSSIVKLRNIDVFVPVILEEEIGKACQRLR
jgi:regulatory protein YycI of two-component signal transduction system YycFG